MSTSIPADQATERTLRLHRALGGSRSEAFEAISSVGPTEEYDLVRVIHERRRATEHMLRAALARIVTAGLPDITMEKYIALIMGAIDEKTERLIEAPWSIEDA